MLPKIYYFIYKMIRDGKHFIIKITYNQ